MNQEAFSVLISVYFKDHPLFLREALESVWTHQVLRPTEIVIVKDGPLVKELDDVIDTFSEKAPVKIISLKENKGLGTALSIGISACSNNLIARMDSDDISRPHRFSKQIKFLSENPEISVLGSWIDEFHEGIDKVVSQRKVPTQHNDIISFLKGRCPFNHPTVILKRSDILNAGNYQPFHLKEDMSLWIRLAERGYKFSNLSESLLYYRMSSDTIKRRGGIKYAKSEYKVFLLKYRLNIISWYEFLFYCSLTIPVRLFPNKLREFIYYKILR